MRSVLVVSTLILASLAAPVQAQQTGRNAPIVTSEDPAGRLDALFLELKRAGEPRAAERISNRIRQQWARSGSASIDLLMQWAQQAIDQEKTDVALDFLDQVIVLAPRYPEGWNRRATLHYSMDDYGKAMDDIAHVLELEPRHFGALGGMAAILTETGRKEAAIRAYRRLLDIYPSMREAQSELGKLVDEATGEPI